MIKKTLVTACVVAAALAPAAVAAKGGEPTRPVAPSHSAPAKAHRVAYVVSGVVTALGANTLTVDVKRANRHARRSLAGATTLVVTTGATTRFTRSGKGHATFADVPVGARVVVTFAGPRGADLTALVARRVSFRAPKPAPAP
jgi:hypothetical protein